MESIDITRVRAARALLAWSQADLAAAAGVAKSTIADFERGLRTPHAKNLHAIRIALERSGVDFSRGGVEFTSSPDSVPVVASRPISPLRLIEASDLTQWCERIAGQMGLPELVYRLILGTLPSAPSACFPSGDSVGYRGWDGRCEAGPGAPPYVPAFSSVWEMGAQRKNITQKANSDYRKRSSAPFGVDPDEATYVFVTPHRWSKKSQWISERRAEKRWKDVIALDSDDLVHWLEQTLPVAVWLGREIEKPAANFRRIADLWSEWSRITQHPLSMNLVLADRDEEAAKVQRWMRGSPAAIEIQAESKDESASFFYASTSSDVREALDTRSLVVDSVSDARRLFGMSPGRFVVMMEADSGVVARLVDEGQFVYIAHGPAANASPNVIRLPAPSMLSIKCELVAMGMRDYEADVLTHSGGNSVTTLRRHMMDVSPRTPSWAQARPSAALMGALFSGAWNERSAVDREVLQKLCLAPYDSVQRDLITPSSSMDSPVRYAPPLWRVASMRDAWTFLAPYVTEPDVERFTTAFHAVLSEPDPDFDLPPSERWRLRKPGAPTLASLELRSGLIEAATALSVFNERVSAVPAAGSRVDRMVSNLLDKADAKRWWSLRRQLRGLAEASPDSFLSAVSTAANLKPSPLEGLINISDGIPGPVDYLSDLLFALQTLGWSVTYAAPVALRLAEIAWIETPTKGRRRAMVALRQMLLPWSPQTTADAGARYEILLTVLDQVPEMGWELVLALSPRLNDYSRPSPRPLWRTIDQREQENVTREALIAAHAKLGELALQHVGDDLGRWRGLLTVWASYDQTWREKAAKRLSEAVLKVEEAGIADFRDDLRRLIQRHQSFPDAGWAMDNDNISLLSEVLEKIEPLKASETYRWAFENGPAFMTTSLEESNRKRKEVQTRAVESVLSEAGTDGLLDFARAVARPFDMGLRVAALESDTQEALLSAALEDSRLAAFLEGIVAGSLSDRGLHWLLERFRLEEAAGLSPQSLVLFAAHMPRTPETWALVRSVGPELEALYWRWIPVYAVEETDAEEAVENLIKVGRYRDALSCVGQFVGLEAAQKRAFPTNFLVALLQTVAQNVDTVSDRTSNDEVMFSYYAGLLFNVLHDSGNVPDESMATLEWKYLQVLEDSDWAPKAIYRELSKKPEFFVLLLRSVFPPSEESGCREVRSGSDEAAERVADQAYSVLSSWSVMPGTRDDGTIDKDLLSGWVSKARRLCAEAGRAEIGDEQIGGILCAWPFTEGVNWPTPEIGSVIEGARSEELDLGFELGTLNRRGLTSRLTYHGGEQERLLAKRFAGYAIAVMTRYPRVRAILDRIAMYYAHQADEEDTRASRLV